MYFLFYLNHFYSSVRLFHPFMYFSDLPYSVLLTCTLASSTWRESAFVIYLTHFDSPVRLPHLPKTNICTFLVYFTHFYSPIRLPHPPDKNLLTPYSQHSSFLIIFNLLLTFLWLFICRTYLLYSSDPFLLICTSFSSTCWIFNFLLTILFLLMAFDSLSLSLYFLSFSLCVLSLV